MHLSVVFVQLHPMHAYCKICFWPARLGQFCAGNVTVLTAWLSATAEEQEGEVHLLLLLCRSSSGGRMKAFELCLFNRICRLQGRSFSQRGQMQSTTFSAKRRVPTARGLYEKNQAELTFYKTN